MINEPFDSIHRRCAEGDATRRGHVPVTPLVTLANDLFKKQIKRKEERLGRGREWGKKREGENH